MRNRQASTTSITTRRQFRYVPRDVCIIWHLPLAILVGGRTNHVTAHVCPVVLITYLLPFGAAAVDC